MGGDDSSADSASVSEPADNTTSEEAAAEPEDIEIDHATILEILQMFGNDDLAFVVAEEIEKLPEK